MSSFAELTSEPIKTDADNETLWRTVEGHSVWVVVPNRNQIEIRSVLARGVSFKKAHELADKLTARRPGLRFYLHQDTLVMSEILVAKPFLGEHIVDALGRFLVARDELSWVADKVLSKRVRRERAEIGRLQKVNAALTAELVALAATGRTDSGSCGEPSGPEVRGRQSR